MESVDISLATTVTGVSTTFHVLFLVWISIATCVVGYAFARFFLTTRRRSTRLPGFMTVARRGRQRHHGRHLGRPDEHVRHHRSIRPLADRHTNTFFPPIPIQVHVPSDDIQADPFLAQRRATTSTPHEWNRDIRSLSHPPPAYGRWRDSVRADPDLLHWAPFVASVDASALPSPTYEEAMTAAQDNRSSDPPRYMTRDSSVQRMDVREGRTAPAQAHVVEPEMMEVRGVSVHTRQAI